MAQHGDRAISLVDKYRGPVQFGLDAAAWLSAIYAATWLRFEFDLDLWDHGNLWVAFAIVIAAQFAIGSYAGLYHRRWRFGSFEEVSVVAGVSVLVTSLLSVLNVTVFDPRLLPVSVAVGAGAGAMLGMATVRYAWRMAIGRKLRPDAEKAKRVLVFGAGETGEMLVTSMLRNPESLLYPVALLDDDPSKLKMRLRNVEVVGDRAAIADAALRHRATQIVIAAPSAGAELVRDVSRRAIDADLEVSVLPAMDEILAGDGTVRVGDLRPLEITDLLGRDPVETDLEQISGYITGRRVLVTGAGGSIGSELCRQLHRLAPAELVMLDRDEGGLHKVQLQIEGRALLDDRNLVVADIRDRERMEDVFAEHRPDVVFHAAALKHLPLLEMHPEEGVKTNIWGTQNLLEVSAESGVERFVNVSTDKAADPCSVLGYTKRIAERLTAAMAEEADGTYLSVRFGNVLGSRGSVLETFQGQIDAGGPVTVVDPSVTRYFMTVEEAVQLVIQAGAVGRDGEALVLDMGEPVSIDQVARQMIAHSDRDVEIVYTGLRPGEKMHEVLLGPDEVGVAVAHPKISHVVVPSLGAASLGDVHDLHELALGAHYRDAAVG